MYIFVRDNIEYEEKHRVKAKCALVSLLILAVCEVLCFFFADRTIYLIRRIMRHARAANVRTR